MVVVHSFGPSTGEAETRGSGVKVTLSHTVSWRPACATRRPWHRSETIQRKWHLAAGRENALMWVVGAPLWLPLVLHFCSAL